MDASYEKYKEFKYQSFSLVSLLDILQLDFCHHSDFEDMDIYQEVRV